MNSAWSERSSGSSATRLFQSKRWYSRAERTSGAYGLVHDSSRWKNGQRRNMPPADGSADSTACGTPWRRRPYDTWRPPGPLPMTMTGESPGGNGRGAGGAMARKAVRHLEAAGPAADDDDRVVPRRKRAGVGRHGVSSAIGWRCAAAGPAPGASGT